ncbi:MAG: DUF3459 domain-containing protein, partial [Xanthobacteraceae bacterium]
LKGARAIDALAVGHAGVIASWRMDDNSLLTIACNLGAEEVEFLMPDGALLFASSDTAARRARLVAYSTVVVLGRT